MKTIIWDVDDVLNDLMLAWFHQAWLPAHPICPINYCDILENPPHRLLQVDSQDYLGSLDAFRLSGAVEQLPPVPEVVSWFQRYGVRARHVALTATPLIAAPVSAAWVLRHFGSWIRSVNIVPSHRSSQPAPRYDRNKEDFLRWWGKGDILVDDSLENVAAARALGLNGVLVPRPWNHSWFSLEETLDSLTELIS